MESAVKLEVSFGKCEWMISKVSSFCGEFFKLIALPSRLWLIFMYYFNFTVICIFASLPIYYYIGDIILLYFIFCFWSSHVNERLNSQRGAGGQLPSVCAGYPGVFASWLQ